MIDWGVSDMAKTLGVPKENVRFISPYIGGGFGGKLFVRTDALLAALGARAVQRPVKVALPRPLMINTPRTGPRQSSVFVLRYERGKLTAIGHESCGRRSAGWFARGRGRSDAPALRRGKPQ